MTSYVMCNKKKLGIKKSDIECLKKSVEDRKLEYFKSELLKILDKKEKEESGEEINKAFIVQELYKSMTDPLYMAKGGKVGVVGEIRTWNGKKYKKMPNKKWVRIYDTHDKHTEISIARLKGKVRKAQSVDELLEIVMNNTHRFSDENGKPLDIVLELKKEVDTKKKALNAGKPSTKEQIKKEQKEENKTTNAYGFTEQEVKDLNYLFNQFSNHSTRKLNWKAFNEQLNLSTRAGSKILHKITKKLCKDNGLTLSERASLPANAIHDAIDNLFMNYIEPKKKTITLPKVKEWIGKVQAAYDKLRSGKFYKEHLKREERTIDSDLPEEELKQRYKNQRKDLIEWLLKGDESYAMTITPYVEKYGKALGISKKDRETITDDDYNVMYHIGGGKGGDEPPKDGRFEFTQELKQKAVDTLNNPTEKINYVDYTRENYNKLFPRGKCKTPIGTIKMSDNQFERFATKDNSARIKFMGALQQCLQRPDVIIGKTDNKGRYSKLYLKAFLDDNGKKAYLAVVPNIDNIDVVVSNSPRDTKDIAKEIKKAGLCYYIRPALASSAKSGGSRMENSSDGLTSNNSRNEEVKPSDNSNIAQDYTVVNKKDKENPAVKKSFASIVNELKKSYFDNIGA